MKPMVCIFVLMKNQQHRLTNRDPATNHCKD